MLRWTQGNKVTVNRIQWDKHEMLAALDVFCNDWFGPGVYAGKFGKQLSDILAVDYVQLVNSGSSALLLAVQALKHEGRFKDGDKILHPACTFPTSCTGALQSGLELVLVDVEEGTYNIDLEAAKQAMAKYDIAGAIVPHLLGNSPKMDELVELLDGRPLIEDACDTLGTKYDGKMTGAWGDMTAFSFYGSHHITTAGVGGALATNNERYYDLANSMAMWGRWWKDVPDDVYEKFMARYWYGTLGYDMQMSDIQAAFGYEQLKRLDQWNRERNTVFGTVDKFMKKFERWFVLPKAHPKAEPSWFGYPLLLEEDTPFTKKEISLHLIANGIEIRPLFVGNLLLHPAFKNRSDIHVSGELTNSNANYDRAFFIPSWGMPDEHLTKMISVLYDFLVKYE